MNAVSYGPATKALQLDAERCRLVESHVRLAEKLALRKCRWGSEDPDDTRSDALWGLILAARAFKPDRGSFGSYAALWIEGAIRTGRQVRSGVSRRMWSQGDFPTLVSLNLPVGEGGEELVNLLPARCDAEEELLADAIRRLPARDCLVLRLRYYHGLSQGDVAEVVGVSQMQVSRIERAALEKLRDYPTDVVVSAPGRI